MGAVEFVTEAVEWYLSGKERISIPAKKHNEQDSKGKVFASNLGLCPRKRFFEENEYEKTHSIDSLKSKLRMESGQRMGNLIQEAIQLYLAKTSLYEEWAARFETSFEDDGIRGRTDVILDNYTHGMFTSSTLIEIKWTRNKYFAPKLYHVYQMMWYANYTTAFIKMNSTHYLLGIDDKLRWYELRHLGDGEYLLFKDGVPVKADWNNEETLNLDKLSEAIQWHKDYLSGKITTTPFPDILGDSRSWQCYEWEKEPTLKTLGVIKPACPYFGYCHILPSEFVEKYSGGILSFYGNEEKL